MNITEGNEAIGTIVHVSDGTPRPPARFNRKVEAWQHKNYTGILREVKENWDNTGYTRSIETKNLGYAIFNMSGTLDSVIVGVHPEAPAEVAVK